MDTSSGIMGAFAGKPGSAGKPGRKICPQCHTPIYGGQFFIRELDTADTFHSGCFDKMHPGHMGDD